MLQRIMDKNCLKKWSLGDEILKNHEIALNHFAT